MEVKPPDGFIINAPQASEAPPPPDGFVIDKQPVRDKTLSWRQGQAPTMWEKFSDMFGDDAHAQSQKATNSLTYSQMFNISPSQAYDLHDEISAQVNDKLATEKIITEKQGMGNAITSGVDNSIVGMMARQKPSVPFESASQAERWVNGLVGMGVDLPFFMAGYAIGGANPVSGTAGAFGFTAGLRQVLMDRYTKGEVKSASELFDRTGNALKETIKGEVVGGFMGGAGYMAPVWLQKLAPGATPSVGWKAATELATMTAAGKLIEGHLPTAQDLVDNTAILLMMHAGIKGVENAKERIPEVRAKLQAAYVETGVHPKELQNIIASEPVNPKEDIIQTIDRVVADVKKDLPPEPVEQVKTENKGAQTEAPIETPGQPEIVQPAAKQSPVPRPINDIFADIDLLSPKEEIKPVIETPKQTVIEPAATPPVEKPVAAVADMSPAKETAIIEDAGKFPVRKVAVNDIKAKPEELQFKLDVNDSGVQKSLAGDWNELASGNLLLWQAKDGTMYVANGHHRLDLAKQKSVETINAQVLKESDGYSISDARRIAAEANILEGKGTVYDHAEFFRLQPETYTPDMARSRGITGRGYTIGRFATPDTYSQFRSRAISPEAAEAISAAAPGNNALQNAGVKYAVEHPKADQYELTNIIKALSTIDVKPAGQGDLFGWDDSAIVAAEKMGKAAAAEVRSLRDKIAAVQGAAKRPETAKAMGVDVKDPEAIKTKINELKVQIEEWGRWETNPELVAELKKRAGLVEKPVEPVKPQGDVQPNLEGLSPEETFTLNNPTTEWSKPPSEQVAQKNRSIFDITNDVNTALGKGGHVGAKDLTPDQIAARERLSNDIEHLKREAGKAGKNLAQYLKDNGANDRQIAFMVNFDKEQKKHLTKTEANPNGTSDEATSIKNAAVDVEREAMGLPKIETPIGERPSNWRELVEGKVNRGEINPEDMVRKINNLVEIGEKPPVINDEGNHALLYGKKMLQSEHARIEKQIEEAKKEDQDTTVLEKQRDEIEIKIDENQKATKAIGTEQSRALSSRQDTMEGDYSYSGLIQRAKEDGMNITPEVRQQLKDLSEKVEKLQSELDGITSQRTQTNIEKTIKQIKNEEGLKQRKQKRTVKKEELDIEFDNLISAFAKEHGAELGANAFVDPARYKFLIDLARNRIQKGIVKAEDIVDTIHTALKNAGIEMSKRDIQDTISQYGVLKEMSKDEIDVSLREAKRQMQLLSALEDAKSGKSPEKSGLQRGEESERVRELTRQVQEAMKESGLDSKSTRSPEEQWKTSLDAVKTRLVNRITDLSKQIDTGEKTPKKTGVAYDAEANALKEFRDGLQKIVTDIEGKPEMSPEQKVKMATAAVEKSITEYERRIKEKDLNPQKKESATPETPELKALRDKRDALKKQYEDLKRENQSKPEKDPQAIAQRRAMDGVERSINEYTRRIAEKELEAKPKESLVKDTPMLVALRQMRDALKDVYKDMQDEANPKKSPEQQKIDAFMKLKERQIAEYERRLKEGDFSKTAKPEPRTLSDKELKIQYELDKLKQEYEKARMDNMLSQRDAATIAKDSVFEALNLIKAIKSSYDISAPGRQGLFFILSHPIQGFKNLPEMFRALKSDEAAFRIQKEISERPNFKNGNYKTGNVSITEVGGIGSKAEEMYRSRWAQAVPGIPASERAFVSFLNLSRADLFDSMHEYAFEGRKATKEELQALGDYVNQATGRGTIKGYENALQGLGSFLWAPKLVLSRFQMILGKGLLPGGGRTAATRKAVAREYARILGSLATIYAVNSIINDKELETDPTSSDFGKIVIGNTRIDPLGGVAQVTVFMGRLAFGETKSINTGQIKDIRGDNVPYGGTTTFDVIANFMRTKLTPALGLGINLLGGKDLIGNKVELSDIPAETAVPLAISDIYQAMNEEGVPAGAALGILGLFGVGIQTHEQKGASR
jgi:hypothetical protein